MVIHAYNPSTQVTEASPSLQVKVYAHLLPPKPLNTCGMSQVLDSGGFTSSSLSH